MQKRKFDELISHFNRKVSDMSIDQKYKMELLGMISAIGFAHEEEHGTNLAEVGTDCISRQQAIDAVNCVTVMKGIRSGKSITAEAVDCAKRIIADNIRQLPPIQPKRIRGQWSIKGQAIDTVRGYWATCSACGHAVFGGGNYCPNCGSYNKGEVIT